MDENLDCLFKIKLNKVINKVKGDKRIRVWLLSNWSFDGCLFVLFVLRWMCYELSVCCDFVSFFVYCVCVGDDFELLEV